MIDSEATPWSEEEEALLRESIGRKSYKEIAEELGRTEGSVCSKIRQLRLSGFNYSEWDRRDLCYLRRNFSKMSLSKLSKRLGRTVHSIQKKAYRLGLRRDAGAPKLLPRKRWTAEDEKALREMAESMTIMEIAERMDRTENSILTRCSKLGIKVESGRKRQFIFAWPPEKQALLRAGAEAGKSLNLIAEDCGKTVASVLKALRRLGIKRADLSQTRPWGRPRKGSERKKAEKRKHPFLPEGWISARQAKAVVGVCIETLRDLCRLGRIEAQKDKLGRWIVRQESAKRYVEERKRELEQKLVAKPSTPSVKKKAAKTSQTRKKTEFNFVDEAQIENMSKLDILKKLAGL